MRTVDPELWSKTAIKPKSIFGSWIFKRRANSFESLLKYSLCDAMKEFWANSSLRGPKFQTNDRNKVIRYIYTFILAALLIIVVSATALIWISALETPPITNSVLPSPRSLKHIVFPAVALCSYNLISRIALRGYSTYLNERDGNRTYSVAQIEQNLLHFGALLDMGRAYVDVRFTKFLSDVGGERNVTNLMLKLSPRCMELLVRCSWLGYIVPCDQLFAVRLTPHGFCCAFNSRYQLEDLKTPAKKVHSVGKGSGLGVVIRENSDDFAYVRRPDHGIGVLIWDGREYPVSEGGPVVALSAHRNASVSIVLKATVQYADRSLRYVSEKWSGCRMPKYGHAEVMKRSYGWCLLKCGETAMRALCSCTPYTMRALHSLQGRQPCNICSLDHLNCAFKHREMFMYYKSTVSSFMATREEYEEALDCPHCLPDCAKTRYTAKVTYSPYHHLDKLYENELRHKVAFANTTFMHIFFDTFEQKEILAETTLRWHELIAKLCSIWLCIAGSLLFAFFELVFYCTVRWRRNYVRRREMLAARRRLWTSLDTYSQSRDFVKPIKLQPPENVYTQ